MAFVDIFTSVIFSREHRSLSTASASARTRTLVHSTSIEQHLAGRSGDNGLRMRWTADDTSLRATLAGPKLAN